MEMVKSYYDALWLINNSWMDEKPTDDLPEFLKIEIKCRHRQMLIRSPLIKSIDRNNRSDAIVEIVRRFNPGYRCQGKQLMTLAGLVKIFSLFVEAAF